ncbi:MAG: DUF2182 domain-containing protein [Pseudanabaenales cyanobacterium]|nr:DUF2182 domain-containing protein [Pseudanabaenales cyanobacterium]
MSIRMEAILKRDRWVVLSGLALVILLSWIYLLVGAGMGMSGLEMTRMSSGESMGMGEALMQPAVWSVGYALLMFFMWWIMMIAMMLPSATPMILLAAALNRNASPDQPPYGASGYFAAGYLLAWALFSCVAVVVQWGLTANGLLSSLMQSTSAVLTGGILIAAGLWQFTSIKHACLRHCRSPAKFLTHHRRKGNVGSLVMGLEHGVYCVGCCWFLMAMLLVGGVMNLYWIMGLAVYVLIEKVFPKGERIGQIVGVGLIVWGLSWLAIVF